MKGKISKINEMEILIMPIKFALGISSIVGTIYGLFFLLDVIYEGFGSDYKPTEEFKKYLVDIIKAVRGVLNA